MKKTKFDRKDSFAGLIWFLLAFILYPIGSSEGYYSCKKNNNNKDAKKFVLYGIMGVIGIIGFVFVGFITNSYKEIILIVSISSFCFGGYKQLSLQKKLKNLNLVSKTSNENGIRKLEKPIYMMATKAFHDLGDISESVATLCIVHSEDNENFIGDWPGITALFGIKFPKNTTRKLTEDEEKSLSGSYDFRWGLTRSQK